MLRRKRRAGSQEEPARAPEAPGTGEHGDPRPDEVGPLDPARSNVEPRTMSGSVQAADLARASDASASFVQWLRRAGGDVPDDFREQRVQGLPLRQC
jgi:hypothetical protein